MTALNPNHPTTRMVSDQWHKLAALAVVQAGGHVVITSADLATIQDKAIAVYENAEGLHMKIVSMAEAENLARVHGGLPQ